MIIAYAHHGFDIGQMIVSSVVHGLVYGVIYKVFQGVSTSVMVGSTILVIGMLWLFFRKK